MATGGEAGPYLQARGLSKSFGHVRALENVDVDVFEGEVLAIVGDNGAGKSTLIKILSGVHQADRGELEVGGQPIRIADPHAARQLGIATVFQNLALVDMRDVAANLYLGREPVRWRFFVDRKKMLQGAREVMRDLRVNIPSLTAEVGQLSGGQRQSIALGRATAQHGRVIIMDEPTAALGVREVTQGAGSDPAPQGDRHRHRDRQPQPAPRVLGRRSHPGAAPWPPRRGSGESATAPDEIVKMIVGVEML